MIEKGQEGLEGYSTLLQNIKTVLVRNRQMVDQLARYNQNIGEVSKKTNAIDTNIRSLNGDVSQQEVLMMKMEKTKDRINGLLQNVFQNMN